MSEEKTITIKKSDLWKYSTFVLFAVVIIGGIFMFTGDGSGSGSASGSATQVPTNPTPQPSVVSASVDDDPFLGSEDAPVTIIEFSDYQCPFCRKFWVETLPLIKSEYIDTGKVKFVYRDFPLVSLHSMAIPSAEAAECVRDEAGGSNEAYFEYHDKIFGEQNILDTGSLTGSVRSTVTYTNNDLKNWAQEIGYDISSCLDSGKFRGEVQKDISDAQSAGGQGTPFFVILGSDGKGTPLSGAYPFSAFQQIIEAELA